MQKQHQHGKEIVLVIDPGHGGKATGACNNNLGVAERDLTIKIARYLRDYLNEYEGIRVIMTHNGLASNVEMELVDRGMVARNNHADMLVSLHLNDYSTPREKGAEVYVTASKLLPKYNQESTRFGNLVLDELAKLGIQKRAVKTRLCGDRGPKWQYSDGSIADYYGVIRYPMKGNSEGLGADLAKGEGIPGVIIEHCFINDSDAQFIDSEQDLKNLARADCNALVRFYGLEKKDITRVSSITLNKSNLIMMRNQKQTLTASVKPDTAVNKKVIWSSSNEQIASVSQSGEVTAKGVGKATITAKTEDRGKVATCSVEVKEVTVTTSKKEINLLEGKKAVIDYSIGPDFITDKTVTWQTSDASIVEVAQNGVITAKKEGTANIILTTKLEGKKATVKVNVHKLKNGQILQIKNLKEDIGRLSKIQEKTSVDNFKKNFTLSSDLEIVVMDKEKNILQGSDFVGSRSNIYIREKQSKQVLEEFESLIYGEIDGNGVIDSYDMYLLRAHMIKNAILKGTDFKLANISRDDEIIDSYDMYLLRAHMINKQKIEQ